MLDLAYREKVNAIMLKRTYDGVSALTAKTVGEGRELFKGQIDALKLTEDNSDFRKASLLNKIQELVGEKAKNYEYDNSLPPLDNALKILISGNGVMSYINEFLPEVLEEEEYLTKFISNVIRDFKFARNFALKFSREAASRIESKLEDEFEKAAKSIRLNFEIKTIKHYDEFEDLVFKANNSRFVPMENIKTISIYNRIPTKQLVSELMSDQKYGPAFTKMMQDYNITSEDIDLYLSTVTKTMGKGYTAYLRSFSLTEYWKGIVLLLVLNKFLDTSDITYTTVFKSVGELVSNMLRAYETNLQSPTFIYSREKRDDGYLIYILAEKVEKLDPGMITAIYGAVIKDKIDIGFDTDKETIDELKAAYIDYQDEKIAIVEKSILNTKKELVFLEVKKIIIENISTVEEVFGEKAKESLLNFLTDDELKRTVFKFLSSIPKDLLANTSYLCDETISILLIPFNVDKILKTLRENLTTGGTSDVNNAVYKSLYTYILDHVFKDITYETK